MSTALFIGRFQPFHKGHLDAISLILKNYDRVIIAIGSAEKNFLPKNPLTSGERFEIIEASLKEAKIPREKFLIIPIIDINNYTLWVSHINTYLPPYQAVYTGSELVKICFDEFCKNVNGKNCPKIFTLKRILKISGDQIRTNILKDKKWEHLVMASAAKILKKLETKTRLEKIS